MPTTIIELSLSLGLEILKSWNNLKPEQRDVIVDRWINDDEKRRKDWGAFTRWFEGLFGQGKIE